MFEIEGFEELCINETSPQASFYLSNNLLHCNSTVRRALNNSPRVHPMINRKSLQFAIIASTDEQDLPLSLKRGTSY